MKVLPVEGGLLDQDPVVVELIETLIGAINERQQLEQKRAKAQTKH